MPPPPGAAPRPLVPNLDDRFIPPEIDIPEGAIGLAAMFVAEMFIPPPRLAFIGPEQEMEMLPPEALEAAFPRAVAPVVAAIVAPIAPVVAAVAAPIVAHFRARVAEPEEEEAEVRPVAEEDLFPTHLFPRDHPNVTRRVPVPVYEPFFFVAPEDREVGTLVGHTQRTFACDERAPYLIPYQSFMGSRNLFRQRFFDLVPEGEGYLRRDGAIQVMLCPAVVATQQGWWTYGRPRTMIELEKSILKFDQHTSRWHVRAAELELHRAFVPLYCFLNARTTEIVHHSLTLSTLFDIWWYYTFGIFKVKLVQAFEWLCLKCGIA
jgi:hypothetical protein